MSDELLESTKKSSFDDISPCPSQSLSTNSLVPVVKLINIYPKLSFEQKNVLSNSSKLDDDGNNGNEDEDDDNNDCSSDCLNERKKNSSNDDMVIESVSSWSSAEYLNKNNKIKNTNGLNRYGISGGGSSINGPKIKNLLYLSDDSHSFSSNGTNNKPNNRLYEKYDKLMGRNEINQFINDDNSSPREPPIIPSHQHTSKKNKNKKNNKLINNENVNIKIKKKHDDNIDKKPYEIINNNNNDKLTIKKNNKILIKKTQRTPWKKLSKIIEGNLLMDDNDVSSSEQQQDQQQKEQDKISRSLRVSTQISTKVSTSSEMPKFDNYYISETATTSSSISHPGPGPIPWSPNICEQPTTPPLPPPPPPPPLPPPGLRQRLSSSSSLSSSIIKKKKKDKLKQNTSSISSCSSSKTSSHSLLIKKQKKIKKPSSTTSSSSSTATTLITASTSPTISTREISINGQIQKFNILSKTQAVKKGYGFNNDDLKKKKKDKKITVISARRKRKTFDDNDVSWTQRHKALRRKKNKKNEQKNRKKRQKKLITNDDDDDVDVGAGAAAAAVSTADGVDTPEIVKLPMKKLCSCENTDCNENICINRETLDVTLSLPTVADLQNVKNDTVELLQIPIDDSNNNKILISMNVNQVISSIEDKEPIDENINNNNNNNNNSSKKPSVKTIEILPKGSIKFTKKIPVKKRSQDEDEIIDNDENTKPLCNNLTKIKLANNENINNYLSNVKLNNDDDNDNNKLIIENEENQNNRKINKCNLLLLDDGRQSMCSKTSALSEKALSVDLEKLTPNIIEHYQRKLSNNSIDTTNKIQAERCISTNSSVATDKTLLTSPNKNNHQNNNNSSNNTSSKVKRFSPIRFDKSPVLKKVVLKRNETVKLHLEPKKLILENNSVDDNNNKQSIINNNVAGSQIINNNTNEKIDLSVKRKIEVEEKLPSPKRFKFDRKRQKEDDDDDDDEEGSSKSSLNKIKINLSDKSTSKSPIAKTTTINSKTHDDFIMKWLNKDIDNSVSENNNTTIDNDKTIITNENKSVSPKLTENNLQIYTKNDNSIKLKQNDNISVEKTQLIDEVLDYNQDNDDDLSIDGLKLTEKSVGSTKVIDNLSETGNKKLPSSSSSSSSSSTSSSSNHSCSVTDCSCNNGPTTKLKNNNNNNNKMSFDGNITDTEDLQMSEKFDVKSVKEKLNNQDNHDDEISLFGGDIDDIETEENNNDMDVDVDDNNNNNNNNNNSKNIKINKNMSSLSIATMSNNSNNSNDNNDDGDYKKMHSNNIDPFIEYNNIEFNQIFDEYESNLKQKNNTKSPINDNNNNNNNNNSNNKNRKLITYDYNLNIKKTQINEYPPGIIKKFNGYCFGMLKYARCNNIDRCRFEHTLKPRDEFLNDEQSYVIKLRIEYAIFRGWHFYITHVYENAIKKMDSAKIILELYNDIINKFIDDKNEPVYGLLGPTVIELAERKMPPSHIVNALIKTINNNDTYKPRIIIKKIKNYIENGNYWVTLRELIIMLPQPPDEIIIPILNECILGKATVEQILDVEKNMIQKLSTQVKLSIDQSLMRNWGLLLNNIDDKYQLNNKNTNNNNNNNEKSIVPTIESPSSSTATVQQVHVTPMLTGIKKRLGKLDKLLNNDKNNNNNNHNDNVDDNENDNVIDDINIIENNINDDDNDNQEYEIDTVDNVSKPVCIYQNQLFNFHHNLQIIRNELKKKNYKAVIQILNDVKFNTNELSPFARGFYAILCKEIMPATHHLAEIIHLSVHKGNDVVKLLNLLVKVGNYLLVKLADTGAMGLAYQLVKTLQPYRIELSTSHIILTIEIYIANRHLLKALDLVKQHNLIFVRRSKMKPEEYAKLEYLRRPLINLLLKSLCKDYPKEAFYLFERLLKEQSSCCEPIDLRKHVHDVVASLVRHNHDEQLMTMGLLILKHKVPIFTPTLRVFVIKLFYINRYVAHQMYSYAIGLGAYSIIKVGTFTTMVIHTQWNEEEIYLRIHDLLENISNKLWHLIERPGPKEFSVYLTIEIVPSEFIKQTHIECNKNIIDDTKLKLVEVLDKFEPKIKMIEINERIFKILDYSIVNYVKSNHSLL